MELTISECHRVTRQLEPVQSVVKWHEEATTFAMVDFVGEMTAEEVL